MKILFVEDNIEPIRGIIDHADDNKWEHALSGFNEAPAKLVTENPDLVVLDWMYDAEHADEGEGIFSAIRERIFIPTIIFSALAGTLPDYITSFVNDNPMMEIIPKGDEKKVIDCIEKWNPYLNSVKSARRELNYALLLSAKAMGYFFEINKNPGDGVLQYMLNKRVQYYLDEKMIEGENPPAWIEYDYPPINEGLFSADVLRLNNGNKNAVGKERDYFVIISPSCDISRAIEKENQEYMVLVAQCESCHALCKDMKIEEDDSEEVISSKQERVRGFINTGYNYAKVPMPELPGKIPYMTINLKKVMLIKLGDIAYSEKDCIESTKYYRVASISSPYRENIMWAHMINSCRPGMPNRNIDSWVDDITIE